MWLEFSTIEACRSFQTNGMVKDIFQEIQFVHKGFVVDERMIWVEIEGLPLCGWGVSAYRKIAEIWGKVMFFEDDQVDYTSWKRVCILTKLKEGITGKVLVQIEGEDYVVTVREVQLWSPNIEMPSSIDNETEPDLDLESNQKYSDSENVEEEYIEETVFDCGSEHTNANIQSQEATYQKEDPHLNNEQKEEVSNSKEDGKTKEGINIEKEDSDDCSFPPGFEFMKHVSTPTTKNNQEDNSPTTSSTTCSAKFGKTKEGINIEKEDSGDGSCPPGFEFMKHVATPTAKNNQEENSPRISSTTCSTRFARSLRRSKSRKKRGERILGELQQLIMEGGSMGYDMHGCELTLQRIQEGKGGMRCPNEYSLV